MAQQEAQGANAGNASENGANGNAKNTSEKIGASNGRAGKRGLNAPANATKGRTSAAPASNGKQRQARTAHATPKSALTVRYEALRDRLFAFAGRARTAFFADTWAASALWLAAALACIGLLLWFFFFSGYGTPAEPIYEGF